MKTGSCQNSVPFRIIRRGRDIEAGRRQPILNSMNYLLSTNWNFDYTHWTLDGHNPFTDDHGVVLFGNEDQVDAFCVYRRLIVEGIASIYFKSAVSDRNKPVKGVLKVLLGDVLRRADSETSRPSKRFT